MQYRSYGVIESSVSEESRSEAEAVGRVGRFSVASVASGGKRKGGEKEGDAEHFARKEGE